MNTIYLVTLFFCNGNSTKMVVSAESYNECMDMIINKLMCDNTVVHIRETSFQENQRILNQFSTKSLYTLDEIGIVNVLPFYESIFKPIKPIVKMDARDAIIN